MMGGALGRGPMVMLVGGGGELPACAFGAESEFGCIACRVDWGGGGNPVEPQEREKLKWKFLWRWRFVGLPCFIDGSGSNKFGKARRRVGLMIMASTNVVESCCCQMEVDGIQVVTKSRAWARRRLVG